ncbi:MAG: hypothetical protein AAB553_03405 [Patescibacteria group bacterium]
MKETITNTISPSIGQEVALKALQVSTGAYVGFVAGKEKDEK